MNNQKLLVAPTIVTIITTILLALSPSMIGNIQGQMYNHDDRQYAYDNNYKNDYYPEPKKSSHVDIQKIKCVNNNINVNGIDITQIPHDTATAATYEGAADATGAQNGNGWGDKINFEKNLVNICINVNDNEQVKVSTPEEPEEEITCEDCFTKNLELEERNELLTELRESSGGGIETFGILCEEISEDVEAGDENTLQQLSNYLADNFANAGLTEGQFTTVLNCLNDVFNDAIPPPGPPGPP